MKNILFGLLLSTMLTAPSVVFAEAPMRCQNGACPCGCQTGGECTCAKAGGCTCADGGACTCAQGTCTCATGEKCACRDKAGSCACAGSAQKKGCGCGKKA
jgi:hypothetical protein